MVRYHHHIRHDPRIYASTSPVQKTGVEPDHLYNLVLWLIPVCILCARAYYVLFEWEQYKDNLLSVFQINKGGLAIYGGILGGVAVVLIYCKVKKLSFWSLADIRYLIVPTIQARIELIKEILALPPEGFSTSESENIGKSVLISKILVLDEIRKDW